MGQFGWPPDGVARVVFGLAVLIGLFGFYPNGWLQIRKYAVAHYRSTLLGLCTSAALLSLGYVAFYLHGGPRIIDATAYLLEARGFAAGHFTLPTVEPSASLRGRFLYFAPELHRLAVLFPPGYPAVLALGVLVGSPFVVGAALAAALVWMTAKLSLRLFDDKVAALFAATLSVSNACLRYHTADTMAHGLCALLVLATLYGALGSQKRDTVLSGLALGWLFATRPVTALAVGVIVALLEFTHQRSFRLAALFAVGLLPGTLLWFAYQWSSTGSVWSTTQYAYYSVADGPPGCFRYGFGKGIGCLFEHGSYVAKRLPQGFGLGQAAYVTLLRLRWHALDVLNVEFLFPLVLWALAKAARRPQLKYVAWTIVATIFAYFPFYFDASYPGGGARLFADIIPLEQILVAGFLVQLRLLRYCLPLSLTGFALHGSFEHRQLMQRDGGCPMFEPRILDAQGIHKGLLFVDTDHGFLLGHVPGEKNATTGLVVVRLHGDAHDRLLWDRMGQPQTYHYRYNPSAHESSGSVVSIPEERLKSYTWFEAEAEWPPLNVTEGWVLPVYPPNDCTSAKRGLSFEPTQGHAAASVALPVEVTGEYRLRVSWVARRSGAQTATVNLGPHRLDVRRDALNHQCFETIHEGLALTAGELTMTIETGPLGIVLDRYRLEKL